MEFHLYNNLQTYFDKYFIFTVNEPFALFYGFFEYKGLLMNLESNKYTNVEFLQTWRSSSSKLDPFVYDSKDKDKM